MDDISVFGASAQFIRVKTRLVQVGLSKPTQASPHQQLSVVEAVVAGVRAGVRAGFALVLSPL